MQGSHEHPAEKIKRLQRCVNDLVSILALPAMWTGGEPSQVVSTLLDTLHGMLRLDLVYVRLNDSFGEPPIEMVRNARSRNLTVPPHEIGELLNRWLGDDPQKWSLLVRNRIGDQDISIVPLRMGLQGEIGVIVAGAHRADFPGETERLVLSVAANQAAIGLQEARLLHEQRRVASELDRRVARRTKELAEAERNLRSIINTIPTTAWSTRPDGYCDFLNERWLNYAGLTAQQAEGWGWAAAIHPDDANGLREYWLSCLASGTPVDTEARIRRFDGEYRWFLFRANPLRGEAGDIIRWYGTNIDIEDRKRAEGKLRRSEAFLAQGQRLNSTGTFSWRVDRDEVTFSEELYRIFEFDPDAPVTLGQISRRVHPEDLRLLTEKMDLARRNTDEHDYEIRLRMPDRSVKYLRAKSYGIRDRDGRLEHIGAIQDVTERRLSEEVLGKVRSELAHMARVTSLGALTASIAHEVNQPLSGIVTNASTCLRMLSADPPNVDGALETARRTIRDGKRASEVIARLRALFSKKEATTELVDINESTREVIALSLSDLQRNQVILRSELAHDLPPVIGDRIQLQQVILNLLLNASDAMSSVDDRPRQLTVSTERDQDDCVRLTVQDSGVGIDPHSIEKVFEAFYTTKSAGMGMGLSVSRSIIESHHGRLWAKPNEGPGATFSISIPRASDVLTNTYNPDAVQTPAITDTAQDMRQS